MPPPMGTLQKQFFRMNFGQGLEQKSDAKMLSDGRMLVLQNAKFIQNNRLSKRDGFASVGATDSSVNKIQRMGYFVNQVVGWGDTASSGPRGFYTYNRSLTTAGFSLHSSSFNDCQILITKVGPGGDGLSTYAQVQTDSAITNGCKIYAIRNNSLFANSFYGQRRIVDAATGAELLGLTNLTVGANAGFIRATACGNFLWAGGYSNFISSYTNCQLLFSTFDTTSAFAVSSYTLTSATVSSGVAGAVTFNNPWDWASYLLPSPYVFSAYITTLNRIQITKHNPNGSTVSTTQYTSANPIASVGMIQPCPGTTTTKVRFAFVDTSNVLTIVGTDPSSLAFNPIASYTLTGRPTPYLITGQEKSDLLSYIVYTNSSTTIQNGTPQVTLESFMVNSSNTILAGMTPGNNTQLYAAAVGKPIYVNDSNIYVPAFLPSHLQGQYILYNYTGNETTASPGPYMAARFLAGQAMGDSALYATGSYVPKVASNANYLGGNKFSNCLNYIIRQVGDAGGIWQIPAAADITYDFTYTNAYRTATINNQQIIGGGFNAGYDGADLYDVGFVNYPENLSLVASTTTATWVPGLAAGVYQYIATWEWTDNNGNIHRSETSVPATVTVPVNLTSYNYVTPTIGVMLATSIRKRSPLVALWRTTVNASPPIYYRTGSYIVNPVYAINNSSYNVALPQDGNNDSLITSNEILYTQGGVADNFTIDGTSVICAGPDRLFAADPTTVGLIHVGKGVTPTVGMSFFSGVNINIPSATGPITNMLYMDTSLIVFTASAIYAVQGQGPTDNGGSNSLTQPQLITADVGCDNVHCAAVYPDGILFKSIKGYFRLGRDLSFDASQNYIGEAVEGFNSYSCLRAVLRAPLNQVRFLLSDNATILAYDYFFKKWSQILTSATDMVQTLTDFYVSAATPANGGLAGKETVGTFTDVMTASTGIPFLITTGWVALNSLQGVQRVFRIRLLGDSKSSHTLKVELAYDYEGGDSPTFAETHTNSSSNITTGSSAWQCEVFPLRQKCQSVCVRISDVTPTGESFDLTDMEFEIGVIAGRRFPLAAAKGF